MVVLWERVGVAKIFNNSNCLGCILFEFWSINYFIFFIIIIKFLLNFYIQLFCNTSFFSQSMDLLLLYTWYESQH